MRAPYRRKPTWAHGGAKTIMPPEPEDVDISIVPMGRATMGTMPFQRRKLSPEENDRKAQQQRIAECSKVDDLPPRVRLAYKACLFQVNVAAAFRFAKHAERSGMMDDQVMKVFANIKSAQDVNKFNTLWGSS